EAGCDFQNPEGQSAGTRRPAEPAPDLQGAVDLGLALAQVRDAASRVQRHIHDHSPFAVHYPISMDDKKTHGVEATNQEYARYDQVRKEQQYHLSDATDSGDAYDEEYQIRTVDIGRFLEGNAADRRAFARELGEALRGIGFAILEGHPVDPRLYDEAVARTEEFYTSVPLEEKLRFRA